MSTTNFSMEDLFDWNPTEMFDDSDCSDGGLAIVEDSPKSKWQKRSPKTACEVGVKDEEGLNIVEKEIDRNLEEKAAKYNYSVQNVKSLIKSVITNEHVLAMVKKSEDSEEDCNDRTVFEPKLTRSKAKELNKDKQIPWMTPKPPPPEVTALITEDLQEDEEDEEYVPENEEPEESEDDRDSSVVSDLDHSLPPTPIQESDLIAQTNYTEDGVFKIPPVKPTDNDEEAANIALRTRSKLSLSSTPLETIERAFIPPDITTDMYDLDCGDENWAEFIKTFTKPLDELMTVPEDEDHDPEYNVAADLDGDKVDKEELREDKAVKITKKEVNQLIAELFEECDHFFNKSHEIVLDTHSSISTPTNLPHQDSTYIEDNTETDVTCSEINDTANKTLNNSCKTLNYPENSKSNGSQLETQQNIVVGPPLIIEIIRIDIGILEHQKEILRQQLRQHIQLLTQSLLLCCGRSEYSEIAEKVDHLLNELHRKGQETPNSICHVENLNSALNLANTWKAKLNARDEDIVQLEKEIEKSMEDFKRSKIDHTTFTFVLPSLVMQTMLNSDVFIYTSLLPSTRFKQHNAVLPCSESELHLLALGLEQFIPFVEEQRKEWKIVSVVHTALQYIIHYMMPFRNLKYLLRIVHHAKNHALKTHPVRYYFEHKTCPQTNHYVIPLEKLGLVPPSQRLVKDLPLLWQKKLEKSNKIMNGRLYTRNTPPTITKVNKPPPYNKIFAGKSAKKILPSPSIKKEVYPALRRLSPKDEKARLLSYQNWLQSRRVPVYHTSKPVSQAFAPTKLMNSPFQPKLCNLKFNSSIFEKLKSSESGYCTLSSPLFQSTPIRAITTMPSVPTIFTPIKRPASEMEGSVECEQPENKTENGENHTLEAEEDDTSMKDNIEDINALMIASSTIKSNAKKNISGYEKKKLKIRKDFIAHMTLLTPEDPNTVEEKANSYVQAYYDKLQDRLEVTEYHKLIQILETFDYRISSTATLYEQVNSILLPKYPDLADEFLTFLTPLEANRIGKSKPHFILKSMSMFLQKLGIYFKDQPSQLRKVYRSLTDLASCVDTTMEVVKATILPLLKGNQLLIDWFLQIFPGETLPGTLANGPWETLDINKELCNSSEDLFETVTIPDSDDPYGGPLCICTCHNSENPVFKNRQHHCISCGKRFLQGKVYIQTGKGLRLANVTFQTNNEEHLKRLCPNPLPVLPTKKRTEASPSKQVSPLKDKDSQDEVRQSNESDDEADCNKKKSKIKTPRKRKIKVVDKTERPSKKENIECSKSPKAKPSRKQIDKSQPSANKFVQTPVNKTTNSTETSKEDSTISEVFEIETSIVRKDIEECDVVDGKMEDNTDNVIAIEESLQMECSEPKNECQLLNNGTEANDFVEKCPEEINSKTSEKNDSNVTNTTSDSSLTEIKPAEEIEWDCNSSIESTDVKISGTSENGSTDESSQENLNSDCEESEDSVSLSQSPSAACDNSNSSYDETKWVIAEDRLILATIKERGANEEALSYIAKELPHKSIDKIRDRFETLIFMLRQEVDAAENSE